MSKNKKHYHCQGQVHVAIGLRGSSDDMQDWVRRSLQKRFTCIDCGFVGQLNSQITYRGNDYICWECYHKDHRGRLHTNPMARFGQRRALP